MSWHEFGPRDRKWIIIEKRRNAKTVKSQRKKFNATDLMFTSVEKFKDLFFQENESSKY